MQILQKFPVVKETINCLENRLLTHCGLMIIQIMVNIGYLMACRQTINRTNNDILKFVPKYGNSHWITWSIKGFVIMINFNLQWATMGNIFSDAERTLPKGSCINMLRQDPSVKYAGYRKVWVPYDFKPGPSTDLVAVLMNPDHYEDPTAEKPLQATDDENNFLFEPGTPQCDTANSVAVVHLVMNMYRRALKRIGNRRKLDKWLWGNVRRSVICPRWYRWLSARLQYLHCVSNGDTAFLH